MNIKLEKDKLRQKYIMIRKDISNKDLKSQIIVNKIINCDWYRNAKVILLYKSLDSEVNIDYLIKYSLDNNKIVGLPKVVDNNLVFYKLNNFNDKLIKSKFGILEPIGDNIIINKNIDLVIVPGICFDKNRNRLGFGKGYYDKFLSNKKIKTIGICFNEQIINKVPIEKTDIKLDLVITNINDY